MFNYLYNRLFSRNWGVTGGHYIADGKRKTVTVSSDTLMSIPAFKQGVEYLANQTMKVPCPVYRTGENNSREVAKDHPAYWLLNKQANPEMDANALRFQLVLNAKVEGNAYAYIEHDDFLNPIALWMLPSECVTPVLMQVGAKTGIKYLVTDGKTPWTLDSHKIIHIKNIGRGTGLVGASACDMFFKTVENNLLTENYQNTFYANDGTVTTVISIPSTLAPEDRPKFIEMIKNSHSSAGDSFKWLFLEAGATVQKLALDNVSADLVNTITANDKKIAQMLGIPGSLVNITDGNISYGSNDADQEHILSSVLDPLFINLEREFSRKLLRETELRNGYYIEHNRDALLNGQSAAQTQQMLNEFNNGTISWEEYRKMKNRSTFKDPKQEWRTPVQVHQMDQNKPNNDQNNQPNQDNQGQAQ